MAQPLQSPVNVIIGDLLKQKTEDTNTVAPPTPSVPTTSAPTTTVPTSPSLPSRPYLFSPNPFSLLTTKPEDKEQHEPKTPKKQKNSATGNFKYSITKSFKH